MASEWLLVVEPIALYGGYRMAQLMPGKDRDEDSGQYVDTYRTEKFVGAIRDHGGAASTKEIADAVGCHRDTARRRLLELVDEGEIERRDVGDAALWRLGDE